MSVKLIKTENGQETAVEFESTLEAARALGVLFGGQSAQDIEAQEIRQQLNDELRRQFQRGRSTENPAELFAQYRQ